VIYRFGRFVLDQRTGELREGARRVPLQRKPLLLLEALLERPGELVTRDDLRERLWPGVHVDVDRGLANAVQKVREALGDAADRPTMVETLPRRGYRFRLAVARGDDRPATHGGASRPEVPRLRGAIGALPVVVLLLGLAGSRARVPVPPRPDAWEAYERGRLLSALKTPAGLEKAAGYFRQALEHDPRLAQAWAGLAEVYHFQGALGVLPPAEAYRRTVEAARGALARDGALAEAHAVLAEANFRFGPDDERAAGHFARAVALKPRSATIRHWRANYLAHKGRLDEAVREMEEARRLDPLSLHVAVDRAWLLYDAGRRDEAHVSLKRAVELDDRFPKAHFALGHFYWREKRYPDAIRELRRASELAPDTPKFLAPLAALYGDAGRRGEALATLSRVRALRGRRHVPAELLAELEARLGAAS
jgi:DNA-binding winged helix-turn-helix (wHTH) protein/Tfp pilus assembly protein PilF